MGAVAFVFSGQGAQYPGMGKALYEQNAAAHALFDRLERLRPGTLAQCFSASPEELALTGNTQPCMFAVELAAAAALTAAGVRAQMTAGFSLGEIAALTYSGAVDLEEGFRLVCRRGELMQQAAQQTPGGMMAVVKLTDERVQELCAEFDRVYPVNYNCPGQVAVAGETQQLAQFSAAVRQAGGRAIPLKVQGGFHSPFMAEAAQALEDALRQIPFRAPAIPLYSNYTAQPYDGEFVRLLSAQVCNPVRWSTLVQNMAKAGADTFVEIGPGRTLCGLIEKILPQAKTFQVEDPEGLEKTEAGVC